MSFLDRVRGGEHSVQASYVLGCDGANSAVRAGIGAHMYGLPFQQTWVVDVDTDAELNQWEGCHQLCSPQRAGTYMRVGPTRPGNSGCSTETAADYQTIAAIEPLIAPWLGDTPAERCGWSASPPTPARGWPAAGATAMCSSWVTPPTSPRRSSARAWQPGCATR